MTNSRKALKEHGLRVTEAREVVMEAFRDSEQALTISDIRDRIGDDQDRITLYRTLKSFEEAGLIHRIPDEEHSVKYALCPESCHPGDHDHHHAHFTCKVCGKTRCIYDVFVPRVATPQGIRVESAELILTGVCENCQG